MMNLQSQTEKDLKLSALEKLGDNPDEIDIKYVSYVLKIPLQTIRQWMEERLEQDFQIDISQIEDTECQLIGCDMKNKKQIKNQNKEEEEDYQQECVNIQIQQPLSINTKEKQIKNKKKSIDNTNQSNTDKKREKDLKKQANLIVKQFEQITFEDCKTQENQNYKANKDIKQSYDQLNQQQIEKQHKQKKSSIEKDQKIINKKKLIEQSNNTSQQQQGKSLIIIDDEINMQKQLAVNQKNEKKQRIKQSSIKDKQQTLQDLTHLKRKKNKNTILQNKIQENGIIKQHEKKQNIISMNLVNQNQLYNNVTEQKQDQNSLQINQQYANGSTTLQSQESQKQYVDIQNSNSSKLQNKELYNQQDFELNSIQTQQNKNKQYLDKIQQIPNQFEIIQMFNNNSQTLRQVIQLITVVSNYQTALMQKLDMIYECFNKQ